MREVLFILLVTATAACAQSSAGPAFETASIRPAKLTNGCFSMLPPGGVQYALTCATLRNLINIAYKGEIEGGGPALETLFDLRATAPGDRPWTYESVRPMMKQLLSERFHLVVHPGKREVHGYALVVVKSGTKLHSVDFDPATQGQKAGQTSANFVTPGQMQGRSKDSTGIAALMSVAVHAPVVDHTNLPGLYNVDARFAPNSLPNSPLGTETGSQLPSFFTAIEEQLGLKLEPQKILVDTIIIDHVDPEPTPN